MANYHAIEEDKIMNILDDVLKFIGLLFLYLREIGIKSSRDSGPFKSADREPLEFPFALLTDFCFLENVVEVISVRND